MATKEQIKLARDVIRMLRKARACEAIVALVDALDSEVVVLKSELAGLRVGSEMACQNVHPDCDCIGCERYDRHRGAIP